MENKVKLSIIFSARDDGYGDGRPGPGSNLVSPLTFIERLKKCMESNIEKFTNYLSEDELEIVIVDWSPINGKYLILNQCKDYLHRKPRGPVLRAFRIDASLRSRLHLLQEFSPSDCNGLMKFFIAL